MTLYVKQKDARNLLSFYCNQEYNISVCAIYALLYYLNQNYSPNTTSSFQQIFLFEINMGLISRIVFFAYSLNIILVPTHGGKMFKFINPYSNKSKYPSTLMYINLIRGMEAGS